MHASSGLAGGGFGGVGGLAVFADDADESLGGAGEAAVAAVDEAELAPEVHAFDGKQLYFPGFHVVLCETLANEGNAGVGGNEALDHADTGQFHGDVNARAVRPEKLVENLAGEAGAGKNKRLLGDFGQGDLGAMSERIASADHEAEAILVNMVHLEIRRLDGQGDDANVNGTVLDALQDLVAEIPVNADVHERITALKLRKNIGKEVEAGGFIGAKDDRSLNDVATIGNNLNGFIAHAKELFGILEKNLAGGSQLDGLGGTVKEPGLVGLLELANLGANRGLRAKDFLARA